MRNPGSRAAAAMLVALVWSALLFSSCEKTVTETVGVPVPGVCDRLYSWKSVWPPLTANSNYAVYGTSESNVFVASQLGGIDHYNGTSWTRTNVATNGAFQDVWCSSSTNAYAVGDAGIYEFDGSAWNPIFGIPSYYYYCVWGASENDVWFGSSNYFTHWDGASWTSVSPPMYNYFRDMWGTAWNDIYAVGQSGTTGYATVWHYNGSDWEEVGPAGMTNYEFSSVWGTASDNVYVVGDDTTIRRWNGSSWVTMTTTGLPANESLRAIRGRGASDIYVATYNEVYHYAGSSWSATNMSSLGIYPYTADLWIGPTRLFAAGEYGVLASYDGVEWRNENGGPWRDLQDVWTGGPNEAVMVGSKGTILKYDGTTVTEVIVPGMSGYHFYGIAGSSGNLYVVGNGSRVLHYDGSAWSDISDPGVFSGLLMDVWASGNQAFAVGSGGSIVHISGTTLEMMDSGTTEELYGVWGSSMSDIFAVGYNGTLLHYDGSVWNPMDCGIDDDLVSITGSSASDVYVMSAMAILLHYDGSSWEIVPHPVGATWTKVWMAGPADLFSFAYSLIYRYDGAAWVSFPYISFTTLNNIAGSGASNVFAVGYQNTILRYGP